MDSVPVGAGTSTWSDKGGDKLDAIKKDHKFHNNLILSTCLPMWEITDLKYKLVVSLFQDPA